GPVIDADALGLLEDHAKEMAGARLIAQAPLPEAAAHGSFFAPRAWEIDSIGRLERENFGPALHVVRWKADQLDQVVDAINATGRGRRPARRARARRRGGAAAGAGVRPRPPAGGPAPPDGGAPPRRGGGGAGRGGGRAGRGARARPGPGAATVMEARRARARG